MFFCYAFESHNITVPIFMHLCVTLLVLIVFSADPVNSWQDSSSHFLKTKIKLKNSPWASSLLVMHNFQRTQPQDILYYAQYVQVCKPHAKIDCNMMI
jgi:hypothetical protein